MKLNRIFTVILFTGVVTYVQAQEITMDELKKYVVVMDSIETLKTNLTVSMNNLSKGNAQISSNRFNTLMPLINNEAKLTEAKATPEEIAYVMKAVAIRNEETMKFQQTYQSLINDYLGQATFSKVRNGLKSDTKLKKAYDSLITKPIRP